MPRPPTPDPSAGTIVLERRRFLRLGALAVVALPSVPALLAACGPSDGSGGSTAPAPASPAKEAEGARATSPAAPAAPAPRPSEPAAPAPPAGGETRLVTEVPANAGQVQALQYVNETAKPDQHCGNCIFYTPQGDEMGRCQLFAQGVVKSTGWCRSWQRKA